MSSGVARAMPTLSKSVAQALFHKQILGVPIGYELAAAKDRATAAGWKPSPFEGFAANVSAGLVPVVLRERAARKSYLRQQLHHDVEQALTRSLKVAQRLLRYTH